MTCLTLQDIFVLALLTTFIVAFLVVILLEKIDRWKKKHRREGIVNPVDLSSMIPISLVVLLEGFKDVNRHQIIQE